MNRGSADRLKLSFFALTYYKAALCMHIRAGYKTTIDSFKDEERKEKHCFHQTSKKRGKQSSSSSGRNKNGQAGRERRDMRG